jgi:hypothetical protein
MTFLEQMTLDELKAAEVDCLEQIEERKAMPGFVQYDFDRALEARLGRIRRLIAEADWSDTLKSMRSLYNAEVKYGLHTPSYIENSEAE